MFRPEDLIQDEIEQPVQTQQLQQSYISTRADQQSLLRIRTRLLEQRALATLKVEGIEKIPTEPLKNLSNKQPEPPLAGQFFFPPVIQPARQKKRSVRSWRLVALVAALCVILLGGTWYALSHSPSRTEHPTRPRVKPTATPGQTAAPLFDLSDITMTSATIGWAKEADTSSGSDPFTVARTTDGGKTWQRFDFQGRAAGQIGHFFLDDQTAWVLMGSSLDPHTNVNAMRTTDGGLHWKALQLPPEIDSIAFLDRLHGWAWSTGFGSARALYTTVDGGVTWNSRGAMSATRAFDDPNPGPLPLGDTLNLTFLTPQRGWAVVYTSQVSERAFLYLTQDGGTTWQLQQLPQPVTGLIPGIQTATHSGVFVVVGMPKFFTPQNGILSVLSLTNAQSPRRLYLYTTSDGGQNWVPSGVYIEGTSSSGVSILDVTHLLLVDSKTISVYAFVNGQWQVQATSHLAGVMFFSFINGQFGWACGNQLLDNQIIGTLYATSDGGRSWHTVAQSITAQPPNQGEG